MFHIKRILHATLSIVTVATLVSTLGVLGFTETLAENSKDGGRPSQGEKRYRAENSEKAAATLTRANVLDSGDTNAYFLRGDALRQDGKLLPAINDLRTVLRLDPEHAEAWRSLGKAYRSLGRFHDELTFYQKAAQCTKDENLKRKLEDWIGKIVTKLGSNTTKAASQKAEATKQKAQAVYVSGNIDEAAMLYRKALNLAPGDSSICVDLAEIQFKKGDRKAALELVDDALILDPDDVSLNVRIASVLHQYGDEVRAAEQCRKVVKLGADNPECLAVVRQSHSSDEMARQESLQFPRKLASLTSDSDGRQETREISAEEEKIEANKASYAATNESLDSDKASESSSGSRPKEAQQDELIEQAVAAERTHEWERAIELYRKVIEQDSNNPVYHYKIGLIYEIIGKCYDATNHYEQAVRLKADYVEALLALGDVNAITLGDLRSALQWYEKAGEKATDSTTKDRIIKKIGMLKGLN